MSVLKKAAVALAATSLIIAPVAASAAPVVDDARATSTVDGQSDLGGGSGWLIGLLGLLVGVTFLILAADDNNDDPISP